MPEQIQYSNIKITGIPFLEITTLTIHNAMNEYGNALIIGSLDSESSAKSYADTLTNESMISITTSASGQPQTLFVGKVSSVSANSNHLSVRLVATASSLDMTPKSHTYQNQSASYSDIINKSFSGAANLTMSTSDQPISSFKIQYNETDFAFAKRMASDLQGSICANCTSVTPEITIGAPQKGKQYTISSSNSVSGQGGTSITSLQYCEVGDQISANGASGIVSCVDADLKQAVLHTTVTISSKGDFKQQPSTNPSISGRMLKGKVVEVKQNLVKVDFSEIDPEGDPASTTYFPYSTAYSSGDGSGFYCMPQEGDYVHVFFPSANEGEAFAASAENVSPLDDPTHKKWRSPAGKEILFTENGIYITCKEGGVFINLEDESGISIVSDSDINIMCTNNMTLYAGNVMNVLAEKKILLSSGTSYIEMTEEQIQMGGESVLIK